MVTFAYSGTQLVLPNPQLGNREAINLRGKYNRMMDGGIYGYKLGIPITSFDLDFANVNRPKVLETINFLRASAGQIVTFTDHRNVVWTGHLMDAPFDASHAAIRDNRFKLMFEGTANG